MGAKNKHAGDNDRLVSIQARTPGEGSPAPSEASPTSAGGPTLFDVVSAVIDASETEAEAIATVCFMLESGSVRLAPAASDPLSRAV